MSLAKKLLIFAPFVYLSIFAFAFVMMVLGSCSVTEGQIVCADIEYRWLEGSMAAWGVGLSVLPLVVSYGLIWAGSKGLSTLDEIKGRHNA